MDITLKMVRKWKAHYPPPDQLAALYSKPRSPLEVLTLTEGPWAAMTPSDRLWTVLHEGVLSDRILRHFTCDRAEKALSYMTNPDSRSVEAVKVARRYADGEATDEELVAAQHAAYHASYAHGVAEVAAYVTTYTSASDAANAAIAVAAVTATEQQRQVERLAQIIQDLEGQ